VGGILSLGWPGRLRPCLTATLLTQGATPMRPTEAYEGYEQIMPFTMLRTDPCPIWWCPRVCPVSCARLQCMLFFLRSGVVRRQRAALSCSRIPPNVFCNSVRTWMQPR